MHKFSWDLSQTIETMAIEQGMNLSELIKAGIDLCKVKVNPQDEFEKAKVRLTVAQNRFNFAVDDDVEAAVEELNNAELNYRYILRIIKKTEISYPV